jgi:crossover junction endodeoxyribonuclease RuvC
MAVGTPFRSNPLGASPGAACSPLVLHPRLPAAAGRRPGLVLGIDPGTRVVGFGAVHLERQGPRLIGAGVLRTSTGGGPAVRLGEIRAGIDRILDELRPEIVVVERAFAARNVASALRIGEGRGVVLSAAAASGALVIEMPPAAAKKALVGNGQAHKTQVAAMVARLLGLERPPDPLDATDALALALAHYLRGRLELR